MITRNISHFGVLVYGAEAATKLWEKSFGLPKFDDWRIDVESIRSTFVSVRGTWDEMVIKIMEPLDKPNMDNALSIRLALVGEGFYHVCLKVDDVEGSGRELKTRHMTVLTREPTEAGASVRWLVHPKDANGVMVEAVKRL